MIFLVDNTKELDFMPADPYGARISALADTYGIDVEHIYYLVNFVAAQAGATDFDIQKEIEREEREAAKRRQRISDIEKETTRLEAEQKELEAKFGGSCSSEDLKRYEENANKLASLYDEYFELNEE